jgi:hypothetical protein
VTRWWFILLAVVLGWFTPAHAFAHTRAIAYDVGPSSEKVVSVAGITMDTSEGNQEDPLSLHKYIYGVDNPVDKIDPSGHDADDFSINIASIFGLLAQIGTPVTSEPGFAHLAFASSITIEFSVDTTRKSRYFDPVAVQSLLQTEMSGNVFNSLPPGNGVNFIVNVESSAPAKLGWSGTPKNKYINRVTWDPLGVPASSDHRGDVQIDPDTTDSWTSTFGKSPTAQTWVNLLAHEGVWRNAGDHWDHDWNPDGELSSGGGNALSTYTVAPSTRATLRKDFGF